MLDEKLLEPFQGLPPIASMSTNQGEKKPWDKKSNRLFSVLEVDSRPNDQSVVKPMTFVERPEVPFSTYYTLDKLTNIRDYTELNQVWKDSPVAGEIHTKSNPKMPVQRRSSTVESLISLDGPQ